MTANEWITLVASLVSIIIAAIAIPLSIFFFWVSKNAQDRAEAAANRTESAVKNLEGILDRLYSDSWSMVKDSYSQMARIVIGGSPKSAELQDGNQEANTNRF